jgi:hypothetical protein
LDGSPWAYGLDNPHPVDPRNNPDTALQHDIAMLEEGLCNATDPSPNCKQVGHGNHFWHWVGIYADTPTNARNNGFSIDRRPFLEARAR